MTGIFMTYCQEKWGGTVFEFIIAVLAFFAIRHFFGGIILPIAGTGRRCCMLGATVRLDDVRSGFQEFKQEVTK